MKRYIWIGIGIMLVGAHASGLKDGLMVIDQDQETFLSDIKKSGGSEEFSEDNDTEEEKSEIVTALEEAPVQKVEKTASADVGSNKENKMQDDKAEAIRNQAMAEAEIKEQKQKEEEEAKAMMLDAKKVEEARAQKEKDELLNQVNAKKEELQKAKNEQDRVVKEQGEAEQREVEAYEKKRAEKLAKEKKDVEEKALEKEKLVEKESVAAKASKEVMQEQDKSLSSDVADINSTREAKEAKDAADIAYWEAVQEMRREK